MPQFHSCPFSPSLYNLTFFPIHKHIHASHLLCMQHIFNHTSITPIHMLPAQLPEAIQGEGAGDSTD